MAAFSATRAQAFVAQLELTLAGVCLACLSFVSFPLDDGDEREATRQVRMMTPGLWADGLDAQAFAAVRAACERGIRDGPAALAELESVGPRSVIAREIVRQLAVMLVAQERQARRLLARLQAQPAVAPPELN